jgi:hypothetical protein
MGCYKKKCTGRSHHSAGYIVINVKHTKAHRGTLEHRLVMEIKIGRKLNPGEVVHHINEIRDDNRPENLELYSSPGQHTSRAHRKAK